MANTDIYQVRAEYVDGNLEPFLNVYYWYEGLGGPGNASDLYGELIASFFPLFQPIQHAATVLQRVVVINGMDNTDATVELPALAGTSPTAQWIASNIAAALRCPPVIPGQRHSYKRIGGLVQGYEGNGKWSASIRASLSSIAAAMDNSYVSALGVGYRLCQVTGGFRMGVPPVLGRLLNSTWQYNQWPSHQDTRQQFDWEVV